MSSRTRDPELSAAQVRPASIRADRRSAQAASRSSAPVVITLPQRCAVPTAIALPAG